MRSRRSVILVFARAPIPGKTKTRLIPALGEEAAATLHQHLLKETLALASQVKGASVELWCAPDVGHPVFRQLEQQYQCRLLRQVGTDLGERMSHAVQQALRRYHSAVIIGTDCPELSVADLRQAINMLENEEVTVIGPAADGGYYLLGLHRFTPCLFQAMPWGSDKVLSLTRERLQQVGERYRQLPVRHDLDRPEDLEFFPELYSKYTVVKTC